MRSKLSGAFLTATATVVVAGLGVWSGRADEKKAESSLQSLAPKNSEVITNAPALKSRQGGLKQWEQDLFRPFDAIAPKGSLDGGFVPEMPEPRGTPPVVESRRVKELLERRRDWIFETPEEILSTPLTDDVLSRREKEKDKDDKSNLSPVERFYDRLYNKNKKESTPGAKREGSSDSRKPGLLGDESTEDDSDLPLGVQETQREMRKLLAPRERKTDTPDPSERSFSDVFGLGKNTQTREEIEMQRERMDRYKQLVGLPVTPRTESDPLKQFRDIISPRNASLAPTMDTLGGLPQQNLLGAGLGSASALPNKSLLPEGAQIYTPPSLAPALPKIDPPKTLPPPVTFTAPRRAF
jgi:hypothetical protein